MKEAAPQYSRAASFGCVWRHRGLRFRHKKCAGTSRRTKNARLIFVAKQNSNNVGMQIPSTVAHEEPRIFTKSKKVQTFEE
ncbi:MAG: hypothetical protein IJN25_10575 [Clostridia bacterium]|nr:hypothetical protein [Clostridia bacterium]